jgi:hypothetical protein
MQKISYQFFGSASRSVDLDPAFYFDMNTVSVFNFDADRLFIFMLIQILFFTVTNNSDPHKYCELASKPPRLQSEPPWPAVVRIRLYISGSGAGFLKLKRIRI